MAPANPKKRALPFIFAVIPDEGRGAKVPDPGLVVATGMAFVEWLW